jgi:hypothetical protein
MKRRIPLAVLPVIVLVAAGLGSSTSATPGIGETRAGEPWTGSPGVTVPVSAMENHQRQVDWGFAGRQLRGRDQPEREAEGEQGEAAAGGSKEEPVEEAAPPKRPPSAKSETLTRSASVAPKSQLSAGTSFLGAHRIGDATFRPPDTTGAVGPTQIMVTVNGRIRVFNKDGSNPGVLDVTDSTFWTTERDGLDVTDPQVEYDRLSQRWILCQINFDPSDPSMVDNRIMIAVSDGPEITSQSDFTFFSFSQNEFNPAATAKFADYPQLGVDANAVYIGTNDFAANGSFAGTTAFVINKADLLTNTLSVTPFRALTNGVGAGPDSPQPATDMDPNVGEGYIVGPDNASFGKLDVIRINDPGGTPTKTSFSVTVPATTFPESVPAQGSPHKLDALDDRLFEAMIARDQNGDLSLWTAQNIEVNSSGVASATGNRDGARWYQLGLSPPTLIQSGTLFDPAGTNPRFFWIPTIAMNGQGHASLNSSTAGTGRFAEVASTAHLSGDSAGTTEPFDITQTSSSTYNIGDNPERWGDYSQTVVDPTDNMTFWTFQEYTHATDDWGVRVIKLRPPPPAIPTAASPATVASGQSSVSVTVTGTSVNDSAFFDPGSDPGGPGYDNHIDATVSDGVDVNSVSWDPLNPDQVTLDLDTTGVTAGARDVTIINPDGQSSTGSNILVVDSDSTPPPPPTLLGTTPTSPANDDSPLINGGAEGGSTVSLFANGNCSGAPVATGSAFAYTSPGIGVTVSPNTTTTFSAKATDLSNNVSDCSNTLALHGTIDYTEDSTAPQIAIDSGPSGATADRSPTFGFHATDAFPPGDVIGFACSIDTGTASFGPCSSSGTDTPAVPLADGSYTFRVRATDAVGNSSTATRAFSVKTTPPDTTITKGPKKKTTKRRPKFKFAASEPGTTFRCQLDKGAFARCSSPFVPPKLRFGKHVLKVEAVDSLGNVDPTPAVRKFKVLPS